jgi:hypothetical protein
MTEYLARPAVEEYEPFIPYREQEDFILRWYEIDPLTGRFRYGRSLLGRPRGWGKSPLLGGLCIVEGMADVLFDGWDADGQPVGKPWSTVRTPLVHVAAVSEDQTSNTWQPMMEMLREEAPLHDTYRGVEPFDTVVNLPRGKIEKRTSSGRTVKGAPTTFAVLDQTEEWVPSNGGPALAQKIRTNTAKNGGRTIESPNAYIPGDGSVAERSAETAVAAAEGRTRIEQPILWDHRESPPDTDLTDRDSLIAALRVSYGDSSGHPDGCVIHDPPCAPGHVDLEAQIAIIWDPATDVQTARSDYLNQITFATNSWLSEPEWRGCKAEDEVVTPRDAVTLGFDGSRGRAKGKPDASALIGCRVKDGHLFKIAVWEADEDPRSWESWEAPVEDISSTVADAFKRYNVVGFYADPGKDWRSHINEWEAKYSSKVKVKGTAAHPFEWWMTGGRSGLVQRAIEQMESAVRNQDLTHDGSLALTRHVLNARRRFTRDKLSLSKENDYSARKIDAAVAAVLAFQCRLDALSAGAGPKKRKRATIQRVR